MILPVTILLSAQLHAAAPLPEQTGWSGYVNFSIGAGESETNMIAGVGSIDFGDDTTNTLSDSAGSEDFFLPGFQFEAAYTLGDSQTQFYLGNQSPDFVTFDLETTLETHLGVRQYISNIGLIDLSLLATSLPTDVWKDPYITDAARGDTERTSSGLQVLLSQILDTGFAVDYSSREIEIDDERSGENLALDDIDQRLLRREGQVHRYNLAYAWDINEQHKLIPTIGYMDYDLDGEAMAEDGYIIGVKHVYSMNRWRFVSSVNYRDLESEEVNPIYGDKAETEELAAVVTAFYAQPFGLENWTANATVSYNDTDSTIDFYDASFVLLSVGMLYRFD